MVAGDRPKGLETGASTARTSVVTHRGQPIAAVRGDAGRVGVGPLQSTLASALASISLFTACVLVVRGVPTRFEWVLFIAATLVGYLVVRRWPRSWPGVILVTFSLIHWSSGMTELMGPALLRSLIAIMTWLVMSGKLLLPGATLSNRIPTPVAFGPLIVAYALIPVQVDLRVEMAMYALAAAVLLVGWSGVLPLRRASDAWLVPSTWLGSLVPVLLHAYQSVYLESWKYVAILVLTLAATWVIASQPSRRVLLGPVVWLTTSGIVGLSFGLRFSTLLTLSLLLWGVASGLFLVDRNGESAMALRTVIGPLALFTVVLMTGTDYVIAVLSASMTALFALIVAQVGPVRSFASGLGQQMGRASLLLRQRLRRLSMRSMLVTCDPRLSRSWRWLSHKRTQSRVSSDPVRQSYSTHRSRRFQGFWFAATLWPGFVAIHVWVARAARHHFSGETLSGRWWSPNPLDGFGRLGWGTGDYAKVAQHGYLRSEHLEAVFPGVPLLVRRITPYLPSLMHAQLWVAIISSAAATALFWYWLGVRQVPATTRRITLLVTILYPWAFLYAGVPYSDVTLVALVLGAFILVETRHPVLAGVVGALATFTRPNSLPLIPALIVFELASSNVVVGPIIEQGVTPLKRGWRYLRGIEVHRDRLRPAQAGVLLSLVGVGAYSAWLWKETGDPLYFLTVQEWYGHRPVTELSTWLKVDFINNPGAFVGSRQEGFNDAATGLMMLGSAATIPVVVRKLGWAYGVFVMGIWLIAWSGPTTLAPGARYLLPAIPFLSLPVATAMVGRRRLLIPVLAIFLIGSLALSIAFAYSELWLEY